MMTLDKPITETYSSTNQFGKIVIIEDNPVDGHMMKASLESLSGVTDVVHLSSAEEVRNWFRSDHRFNPDLILTDINLPDGNGFSLIDELSEEELLDQNVPIMVMSDQFNKRTQELLEKVPGFCFFLHKPVQPRFLQGLIG